MRFERGPFGKIAVVSLEPGADLVRHALDSLQSQTISSLLPVFVREHLGRNELCIDCTGLLQLSEVNTLSFKSHFEKRKSIAKFLLAILDAEDHFIEPGFLVMDPEYIFFDSEKSALLWCCIPVMTRSLKESSAAPPFPCESLEKLLLDTFFADAIHEDDRNRIICLFRDSRESELTEFLNGIASVSERSRETKRDSQKWICLLIGQIACMILSITACLLSERRFQGFPETGVWTSWFLLIFSFLLIILLMIRRGNGAEEIRESGHTDDSTASQISQKDMYFPAASGNAGTYGTESRSPMFSPAFLTQILVRSSGMEKQPLKAVIWTEDFLIGRDKLLCDLFLDHMAVSDRHARILHRGSLFLLMDAGSDSGTFIGSRRLYAYEENLLRDGDIISIGELRFLFSQTS